jgi:23S rRNA (uracil1939-C5)-methyltransferase
MDVGRCAIEPPGHAAIYAKVQASLEKPSGRPLADALRYVVVRGNYEEFTVLFTVDQIDGPLLKTANSVSKGLTHALPAVTGVLLFEDRSDGRYYLGTRNPSGRGGVRKIFGKGEVYARYGGKGFLYPGTAFSQVNASLVDQVLATASRLLQPGAGSTLYDLYCGYGLFSLTVGSAAAHCVGIERSPESLDAAIANGRRQHAGNVRFIRSEITPESIGPLVAAAQPGDAVLLDPPRGGAAAGVLECIAARRPGRVLHLLCNIDLVGAEIQRWSKSGYALADAVPFDMFPGTDDVEIMAFLTPAARPHHAPAKRSAPGAPRSSADPAIPPAVPHQSPRNIRTAPRPARRAGTQSTRQIPPREPGRT